MLRFRFLLPLMAPVLAVIGWWWYTSRKEKEIAAAEEEAAAVRGVRNGLVESCRTALKVEDGSSVGLVEGEHILLAAAETPCLSLARETLGQVDASSHTPHSSFIHRPVIYGLESSEQGTSDEQADLQLPNIGGDEAEGVVTKTSTCQSHPDDKQIVDGSECGPREVHAAELGLAAEEEHSLAPPPFHSPARAASPVPAQLTEAAQPRMQMDRDMETENITVPFAEHLPLLKDETSRNTTPDALCPEVVIPFRCIPTMLAPPSSIEAEGPPLQDRHGELLLGGLVLDPAKEESNEHVTSLVSDLIPVMTQEKLMVRLHDVSKEGNGRSLHTSLPLSGKPQCTVVDQVEQESGGQMSLEVLCHVKQGHVDDITEQASNEIQTFVPGSSSLSTSTESARDEEVLNACITPPLQKAVEGDISSGMETGQESLGLEDSSLSLGEPHTDDVIRTEDSGCRCEGTVDEVGRKRSDQSSGCIFSIQTEAPCTALDQAKQEVDHPSDRMQHLLKQAPFSEVADEASQNGSASPHTQKEVLNDAPRCSRTTGLHKSLSPEATPLSQEEPHKHMAGTEDSGSSTCPSEDRASIMQDHIPCTVPDEMPILATSQGSNQQSHCPVWKSEPSLEEDPQGSLCREERVTITDLQNGSYVVHQMEGDDSGEISSETLQKSTDNGKLPEESSSCICSALIPDARCTAPGQAQQEDGQTSTGMRRPLQEGPGSLAPADASGNDASDNGPIQEELDDYASVRAENVQKSPGSEAAPSSPDEPQKLGDVKGAEDSGCGTCQSEDGASSPDHVPATAVSCAGPEQNEDLTPVLAISRDLEEQGGGPERKFEPSLWEAHQGTLPRGEGLSGTHLQNGSVEMTAKDADLSRGSGVNGLVNSTCTSGPTEGQGLSGGPMCPQTPDLTVWEIEVPKLLVGRLIGKRGRYVSFLKQTSGAKIHISPPLFTQEFQICHIEGTKQQVHKALGLIRKKFEDLDLTNIYTSPPPSKLPSLPITSWLLLPDDAPVEVTVVKIVSASHMFVQQPKHPSYPALSVLDQDMRLCYSQPAPGLPSPTEAGVICAAPGADGAWWRAQVISFHKECNEAQIRYVDYGGYQRVQMGTLHQIRSDFVTLPFQGAEVVLSNVKPLPGEDCFSAEASTALEEMTRGASLLAQVTSYSDSGVPFIQMWKVVKEELVAVNRALVDRGLATWQDSF